MTKYYIVLFDDHQGNLGRSNKLIDFLMKNGFKCMDGYWGCPWYFISIKDKIYYPGRPGVSYRKTKGTIFITFKEFKIIYRIETRSLTPRYQYSNNARK